MGPSRCLFGPGLLDPCSAATSMPAAEPSPPNRHTSTGSAALAPAAHTPCVGRAGSGVALLLKGLLWHSAAVSPLGCLARGGAVSGAATAGGIAGAPGRVSPVGRLAGGGPAPGGGGTPSMNSGMLSQRLQAPAGLPVDQGSPQQQEIQQGKSKPHLQARWVTAPDASGHCSSASSEPSAARQLAVRVCQPSPQSALQAPQAPYLREAESAIDCATRLGSSALALLGCGWKATSGGGGEGGGGEGGGGEGGGEGGGGGGEGGGKKPNPTEALTSAGVCVEGWARGAW